MTELKLNSSVVILNIKNQWETEPSELVAIEIDNNGKRYYRLKFPTGEIRRVYHDRVRPHVVKSDGPDEIEVWHHDNGVIAGATKSETILTVNLTTAKYTVESVYNGVIKGRMVYDINDIDKLRYKIAKKGYDRVNTTNQNLCQG